MKNWFPFPLIVVLMLGGCASSPPASPMSTRPSLPHNLTAPAPQIVPPVTDSWDDLAVSYVQLARQYGQCVIERAGLIRAR